MAGLRRRDSRRHRGGRLPRLGDVALVLSLLLTLLPACGEGPTGADRLRPDGTSTGHDPADLLVGTWRTTVVVELPGDLQTWTATWRFDADGGCHLTTERESLPEGLPRITERPCTWTVGGAEVTVVFLQGETLVMEYDFADFSPDRLVLEGFEYERVA